MPRIKTAVVAAAGRATRMWPASKTIPKELFPLGRIPVILYLLWELLEAGITEVVIVAAAHNSNLIRGLFDHGEPAPPKVADEPEARRFVESLASCSICIIEQRDGYGNGVPLQLALRRMARQPCVYAFGDDIVVGENITRNLIGVYERTACPVLAAQEVSPDRRSAFGILECERRGRDEYIKRMIEKPDPAATSSNLAAFGRYLVTPDLADVLCATQPGRDGEIWFTDAVDAHLKSGGEGCACRLTCGTWYTVGDPKGYAEAVRAVTQERFGIV